MKEVCMKHRNESYRFLFVSPRRSFHSHSLLCTTTTTISWPIAIAVTDGSETTKPSSDTNKTPATTGSATTVASTFQLSRGYSNTIYRALTIIIVGNVILFMRQRRPDCDTWRVITGTVECTIRSSDPIKASNRTTYRTGTTMPAATQAA